MDDKFFLSKEDAVLVVVDIQERLAVVMSEREKVVGNCINLIEAAKLMSIPVVLTEQYPKGLGPTVNEIKEALPSYEPVEKLSFSCCGEPSFMTALASKGRKRVILCGMETHVCVLQTCIGCLREGYAVHAVRDAICSRSKENFNIGIDFMRDAGAVITGTETVLFQLLEKAGTEEFKAIVKRIK
ncbi:MAG: hydrolase [Nitrospirae bacterium]|nr:hydrolase [Nitrospirota bacterium]MCL5421365.1 hydrolase [Nitrospirota bacterium]